MVAVQCMYIGMYPIPIFRRPFMPYINSITDICYPNHTTQFSTFSKCVLTWIVYPIGTYLYLMICPYILVYMFPTYKANCFMYFFLFMYVRDDSKIYFHKNLQKLLSIIKLKKCYSKLEALCWKMRKHTYTAYRS